MASKQHICPTCSTLLQRVYPRRQIYECPNGHGKFKAIHHRRPSFKRMAGGFDPNDSSTWSARCDECGSRMEYWNLSYHCTKCGNVLQV